MLEKSIILKELPLPPSANKAFYTDFKNKTRHRSKDYRLYLAMMAHWKALNPAQLADARDFMSQIVDGEAYRFDCAFYFPRSKVLTLDGRVKKNDTSNRIKCAHDALAEMLSIDDSLIWDGSFEKKVLNSDHPGLLDVTISIIDIEGY